MKVQTRLYLFLFIVIVFNLLTVPGQTDWGDDYAQYLSQARAIASHNFKPLIEQASFMQTYTSIRMGPEFYPWGFPLLIAPLIAAFGLNLAVLQMCAYLFYAAFLVVLWRLFRHKLDPLVACMLVALFALNPFMFEFKRSIGSDIPFLFASMLFICLMQRFVMEKKYLWNQVSSYAILGAVAFVALFIRTVGVVGVPLLFCCQAVEFFKARAFPKKRELLVELIPYLVMGVLYVASHLAFREVIASYSSKDVGGDNLAHLLWDNIVYYLFTFADFYRGPEMLQSVFFWLTLPVMTLGIWKNWKKDYHYLLFCAFYFGIVLIVPYHQGPRFIFPLWPFYIYFVLVGAASIKVPWLPKLKPARLFPLPILLYFGAVTLFFAYSTMVKKNFRFDGPYVTEARAMFKFVNSDVPSSAVVNCLKPRLMTLTTGRLAAFQEDADKLDKLPIVYTVIDKELQESPPANMGNKHELVFSNSRFEIYKKRSEPARN